MKKQILTSLLALTMLTGTSASAMAAEDHASKIPTSEIHQNIDQNGTVFSVTFHDESGMDIDPKDNVSFDLKDYKPISPDSYVQEIQKAKIELADQVAKGQLTQEEADKTIKAMEKTLAELKAGSVQLFQGPGDTSLAIQHAEATSTEINNQEINDEQSNKNTENGEYQKYQLDMTDFKPYTAEEYAKEMEEIKKQLAEKVNNGVMTQQEADTQIAGMENTLAEIKSGDIKLFNNEKLNMLVSIVAKDSEAL